MEFYEALLPCALLHELTIQYTGVSAFCRAATAGLPGAAPRISPFFLEALASLLSTPATPFPLLETLGLMLTCTIESLADCTPALGELAHVLACKDRYPRFARLAVEFKERTSFVPTDDDAQGDEYDVRARAGAARPLFRAFVDAGVAVDVVVRPY